MSEVVFWITGAYEPIINNAYKYFFEISKKFRKIVACTSEHYMFAQNFSCPCKKDKKCHVNSYVGGSKNFFYA
jgi:hypothetical protein